MKRSEFIRLTALALVGAALPLPKLKPSFQPNIIKVAYNGDADVLPLKKYLMKVSMELLHDTKGFEIALNHITKEKGKPDKIEIGYEGDDFAKNLQTLLLTYNK